MSQREVPETASEPIYTLHSPVDHRLVDVLQIHFYEAYGDTICSCGQAFKGHAIDSPWRQWIEHIRAAMRDA